MSFLKILQNFKHVISPYIFYDENNNPFMYFLNTQNDQNILYFTDGVQVKKVNLISLSLITQVFAYKNFKNNTYCVSFCTKSKDGIHLYYTETDDPTDFKVIDSITSDCRSGIVTPRYIFIITLSNYIFMYKRNMLNKTPGNLLDNLSKQAYFSNIKNIIHISSINKDQNKILISFIKEENNQYGTILYDVGTNIQELITSDTDKSIFEPTIDSINNQILFKNQWNMFNSINLQKINKNSIQIIQQK